MKLGVVFGGGGLVGLGFHAGALKALEERGVDVTKTDVFVGTSAGAIIASYLSKGWSQGDFYEYAHGRHPDSVPPEEEQDEVERLFEPLYSGHLERARRAVGAVYTLAAARRLLPRAAARPPSLLKKAFPSGFYSTTETAERLENDLGSDWPNSPLLVTAADLYAGTRVAFGSGEAPQVPLHQAVLASTSIPGVFPPVKAGGRHYVDGGVVSATSLDLAAAEGCDHILCVAPLGYRTERAIAADPRRWPAMAVRRPFARALRREVLTARASGAAVTVVRPWISDLAVHGNNSMRIDDRRKVAEGARIGTLRTLDSLEGDPVLQAFAGSTATEGGVA